MIYQTIDFNSFQRAFINAGRESQFTHTGLQMLFNYIEELSNDTGQDIELDVIALCCQYSELSLDEVNEEFDLDLDHDDQPQEIKDRIERSGGIVVNIDTTNENNFRILLAD